MRLNSEQRRAAFAAYEDYRRLCAGCEAWDDGDRMLCVLSAMRGGDGAAGQRGEFHKVYADEVQDFTQVPAPTRQPHSACERASERERACVRERERESVRARRVRARERASRESVACKQDAS